MPTPNSESAAAELNRIYQLLGRSEYDRVVTIIRHNLSAHELEHIRTAEQVRDVFNRWGRTPAPPAPVLDDECILSPFNPGEDNGSSTN